MPGANEAMVVGSRERSNSEALTLQLQYRVAFYRPITMSIVTRCILAIKRFPVVVVAAVTQQAPSKRVVADGYHSERPPAPRVASLFNCYQVLETRLQFSAGILTQGRDKCVRGESRR